MFYKFLTEDEIGHLIELQREITDKNEYEKAVDKYMKDIKYAERLAEHYKDKWYIKVLRKICNSNKEKK